VFSHTDYSTPGESAPTRFLVVFETDRRADKVVGSMKVCTWQLLLKSISFQPSISDRVYILFHSTG
jgi:hypothetical protein